MINKIMAAAGSPRLAEAVINVLRTALNKALADEIIIKLPSKSVAIPQKLKKEFRPLTINQWSMLFKVAEKYPALYTALSLEWVTGIHSQRKKMKIVTNRNVFYRPRCCTVAVQQTQLSSAPPKMNSYRTA